MNEGLVGAGIVAAVALLGRVTRREGGLGAADDGSFDMSVFDVFPGAASSRESSPEEKSHSTFAALKTRDRVRIGGKEWIVVNGLHSATEKVLGEPDYFDRNGSEPFFAADPDRTGQIVVSKCAKRGPFRAVGRPVARGLAERL